MAGPGAAVTDGRHQLVDTATDVARAVNAGAITSEEGRQLFRERAAQMKADHLIAARREARAVLRDAILTDAERLGRPIVEVAPYLRALVLVRLDRCDWSPSARATALLTFEVLDELEAEER